jgi:hypothetical protein
VLNNLKFHTLFVSYCLTVQTIQSLQFSVDPKRICLQSINWSTVQWKLPNWFNDNA